ncbi:hypothetical protein C3L33_19555, partial [Rhododendron williamsianum]
MGMKLFEGSDVSDEEDISRIEINKEFARRYEHNKKREDLQKLDELKKNGVVSGSSDSDESSFDEAEKDELTNSKRDLEFLSALIKVKKHDPELRNREAKLFESDDEEDESRGEEVEKRDKKEKKKPMYLKDVAARHLIEEGAEFDDDDDDDEGEEEEEKKKVKSYKEEQEELRREFLDAAEAALDGDDGGELLKERARNGTADDDDDDDMGEVEKKLNEYFGEDGNLDENEKFLKGYFRNRMWVGDEGNSMGVKDLGLSEDEDEVEKQEDYERGYHFRHEENAGDRVLGHSRVVEGSVRKKTNARKAQRKSKEERMAQAEFERKEELKHLKNLKKKEMKEKLRKIMDTAGIGEDRVCPLDVDDLEEEFDPEEYDRKMKKAFNDDYYDSEDVDPEFGSDGDEDELEKPDFDKEDDLLGLPKGWDDASGSGDGFLAFRERKLKRGAENSVPNEQMEDEAVNEDGKGKKKRKMLEMEKEVIKKELEEYYKLDYENTIGDLKTRFKYRKVGAKKFGLNTEEILRLDDKELNQYVSLKKIAPYREKEWKVLRGKRQHLHGISNGQKTDKKLRLEHKKPKENEEAHVEKSRKARRKLRQAELKLPPHRIKAYGKKH